MTSYTDALVKEYCRSLKKCPFCGSSDIRIKYVHNPYDPDFIRDGHIYGGYHAMCQSCYATTVVCDLPEIAAGKWNLRADQPTEKLTYKDIMKLFCQRYGIKVKDYRPASDMYVPNSAGITVWTEEGDTMLYFPKELAEENK